MNSARDVFLNINDYNTLIEESNARTRKNKITDLKTIDGAVISARHNIYDVKIIKEQFVDLQYFPSVIEEGFTPSVVVDIGGYIGDLSLYCASKFNSSVYCYEPTPQNYQMILRNIKNNPSFGDNIKVYNKGVSDTDSTLKIDIQDIEGEIHASSHKRYKTQVKTVDVPCVTLKTVLDNVKEEKIDLLKIDCEGEEFNILKGCNSKKLSEKVNYLVFEYHSFVKDYKTKLDNILLNLEDNFDVLKKSKKLCFLKSKSWS